jgi:hypothetical protein
MAFVVGAERLVGHARADKQSAGRPVRLPGSIDMLTVACGKDDGSGKRSSHAQ